MEAYYTTIKQQQNYKLILSHNSCSVCVSNNSREIDWTIRMRMWWLKVKFLNIFVFLVSSPVSLFGPHFKENNIPIHGRSWILFSAFHENTNMYLSFFSSLCLKRNWKTGYLRAMPLLHHRSLARDNGSLIITSSGLGNLTNCRKPAHNICEINLLMSEQVHKNMYNGCLFHKYYSIRSKDKI